MKLSLFRSLWLPVLAALGVLGLCFSSPAENAVLQVDTKNAGAAIPPDFEGLSFEVSLLLPDTNGVHYFRPDNRPLITLFHTLGIKNLRIGGNTSDRDVRQLPARADLDSLFGFAKAADVKVIYCLRLHNGDPQVDAETVKYIMDRYADQMDSFSIGQEPSAYKITNAVRSAEGMGPEFEKYPYSTYAADWKKFADVIVAAVPGVKFCGPSVHNNGSWAVKFIQDFGRSNHVVLITEHLYPGSSGNKVPTPEIGIDRMLANDDAMTNGFPKAYQKLYNSFVPLTLSNGLPYRLEEVNNYFNGGATNVSNTFASALWGLDFMYWWAVHQAAGLNFHTGDRVAAGANLQPSRYTAYFSTTNGYLIRPLGYGIKAFELGSHGTNLPVTLSNPGNLNLSAYAVLGGGGNLYITLINKEHGTNARDAAISINLDDTGYKYGETVLLAAPDNNVAATSGVTLGGAPIRSDGSWDGTRKPLDKPAIDGLRKGAFQLTVPPASAMVLTCTRANYAESEIGTFTLPDPLILNNGRPVATSNDWVNLRRPEILKLYEGRIFGSSPKWRNIIDRTRETSRAFGGKATRKQVDLEFYNYDSTNREVLHVLLYTPARATGRVPTFLCLSFSGNYRVTDDTNVMVYPVWDRKTNTASMPAKIDRGSSHSWAIEKTIDRGYGIAIVDYNDIEPDLADGSGGQYGVRSLYLKPGETKGAPGSWGAISAWAWGASRVLDYLQTDDNVDPKRVIMLGQSRLGKTALWAGADDPRFAMVIASCSGEMGAALSRRDYGETVTSMCKSFAYQFCGNFLAYSNRIGELPVDSHMLVSLIAPRPLYLSTGSQDQWSDPRGEFEAAIAAQPVYELFGETGLVANLPPAGLKGGSGPVLTSAVLETFSMPPLDVPIMHDIGFQTHTGKHDILPEDWDRFLDFADLHFFGKPPHAYPVNEAKLTP